MRKCFFLDRDGVIIKDRKNIYKIKDIFILPGVIEALKKIKKKNYLIIIITNQSIIGRGKLSLEGFKKFTDHLNNLLFKNSKKKLIDDIFFCPHHPKKAIGNFKKICKCRKPGNKLLEDAILKWNIDRKSSIMIGDRISDYLSAKKSKINFYYKNNSNFKDQVSSILNEKKL
jgi:D,D-heptose 1,7-bisphosphate phosphatase